MAGFPETDSRCVRCRHTPAHFGPDCRLDLQRIGPHGSALLPRHRRRPPTQAPVPPARAPRRPPRRRAHAKRGAQAFMPRSAGCLARYSHSIINGFGKPLIRLYDSSNLAGFTVRCTATSSEIPSRSFHHRSTSIENRRRLHTGQLSRSIDIHRVPGPPVMASTRVHRGQVHA